MSVLSGFFTANYGAFNQATESTLAEYVYYSGAITLGPNNQFIPEYTYGAEYTGLTSYPAYFILLNTLIPISLVVTLEIVKTLQMPFIQHDVHMYDEETGQQAKVSSLTLHEELGTIDYIFADKTGTLTANIMKF
jgi:magnesium-transporting ATPase (P-type)